MDLIRTLVSGKKKRLREAGYDLDLSYITPRIMAMSFPGEGLEKIYRNSCDTVAKFLHERHPDAFRVFNLSGIKFHYDKFGDSVVEYPWLDHHSPPIDLLFKACDDMHSWLSQSESTVTAINCRAGKGRTGTLICCYLLFCGRFSDPDQALTYYRIQRFVSGGGVTQPSQKRYVFYFWRILKREVRGPLCKTLNKVILHTSPHMKRHGCRPYLTVTYEDEVIYSTKEPQRNRNLRLRDDWERPQDHYILIHSALEVKGDLLFKLYHWGRLSCTKICHFAMNTAFIPRGDVYTLTKEELDPDSFRTSSKVSECFQVHIVFQSKCQCTADMDLNDRCGQCRDELGLMEMQRWDTVQEIIGRLNERECDQKVLLFGTQHEDNVEEVLQKSISSRGTRSSGVTTEGENSI